MAEKKPSERLGPLPAELQPDVAELAALLRDLLDETGLPLTALAVRIHWDKGTISRYLSGERVPSPEFIEALFREADKSKEREPELLRRDQARDLYLAALQVSNKRSLEVEELRLTLAGVEKELQASLERISKLSGKIVSRKRQLKDTEQEIDEIDQRPELVAPATASLALEGRRKSLVQQRSQFEENITTLQEALEHERKKRKEAEDERDRLKRSLEEAEARLLPVGDRQHPGSIAFLPAPTTRSGQMLEALLVPATCYLGPLYLGWIYRYMSAAPAAFRWGTVLAVALPLWLLYGTYGIRQPGMPRAPSFILAAVITGGLFLLGGAMR
ncbi:helix-turn-helix domain-containing protein [Actinomadura nitritigenes]|uniref:helix-turn-helix domain-containing protein n=1 Tax=Actinomadura nitritigenes TaxID=134602 RepID=UPI003D8F16DB